MRGKMSKKNKRKQRGYDSKIIRQKNVEKRLEHIRDIKPFGPEPEGNQDRINSFFRKRAKDRQWEEVRT